MPKIISKLSKGSSFLINLVVQKVVISNDRESLLKPKDMNYKTVALIDTGATHSIISTDIVEKLQLESQGKITIATGSSKADDVETYTVLLDFPTDMVPIAVPIDPTNPSKGRQIIFQPQTIVEKLVRVSGNEHISSQGFNAIVGMDILRSAHITIVDGNMIISF